MPFPGQASGGFTESSTSLRILLGGLRNSFGNLTDDAFTQANPCAVTTNVSDQVDATRVGVLDGSIAFLRPDGVNAIGGPGDNAKQVAIGGNKVLALGYKPIGVFHNAANGNEFENKAAIASGKLMHVTCMGTHGNRLFETKALATCDSVNAGDPLVYVAGVELLASRNGLLMPKYMVTSSTLRDLDKNTNASTANTAEGFVQATAAGGAAADKATVIGILRVPADSTHNELTYDQRI